MEPFAYNPTLRSAWDSEIANLESALARGDYAYGGYQGAYDSIYNRFGAPAGVSSQEAQGVLGGLYDKYFAPTNTQEDLRQALYTGSTGTDSGYTPEDIAYLQSIKQNYLDQRGRLDTALSQGNTKIADEYGRELNSAEIGKENQLGTYRGQRQEQTGIKGQNYSQINNAANKGYSSLAEILGRASGTGSSAFQQLLPNVISKDIFSKRSQANNVFGRNMQNIDSSENNYMANFKMVLDDLKRQKDQNEQNLISGVNETRADLASKIGTVEGQLAAAAGGGGAQIRAAQAPYNAEVIAARDAVDNLFNKYFKPFTPRVANAPAPELGTYTMDRSQINAGNQGVTDTTNPYSQILRKRLQEQGI